MIKRVIVASLLLCILGQEAQSADKGLYDQKQCIKNPQLNQQDRILHDAAMLDRLNKAKKALENGANINSVDGDCLSYTPLLIAAHWRKPRMVRYVLRRGGDINAQDRFGHTALHLVAEKDPKFYPKELLGITRALIKAKIDLTIQDGFGLTALETAQFLHRYYNYNNLALIGILSNASKKHRNHNNSLR